MLRPLEVSTRIYNREGIQSALLSLCIYPRTVVEIRWTVGGLPQGRGLTHYVKRITIDCVWVMVVPQCVPRIHGSTGVSQPRVSGLKSQPLPAHYQSLFSLVKLHLGRK